MSAMHRAKSDQTPLDPRPLKHFRPPLKTDCRHISEKIHASVSKSYDFKPSSVPKTSYQPSSIEKNVHGKPLGGLKSVPSSNSDPTITGSENLKLGNFIIMKSKERKRKYYGTGRVLHSMIDDELMGADGLESNVSEQPTNGISQNWRLKEHGPKESLKLNHASLLNQSSMVGKSVFI